MRGAVRLLTAMSALAIITPAHAETKEAVDLDHAAPAELLLVQNDVRTIHYWSAPNEMWLEVFRSASEIEGIADDPESSLGRIKSGGRFWQWRNDAYVPLVEEATISGPLNDELYSKAVAFLGEFDAVPENSPANVSIEIETDGKPGAAGLLAGSVFCSMGGTNCPVVLFNGGEPVGAAYVTISQPWGISRRVNSHGYPFIESQLERSVLFLDAETGEESGELAGITPRMSDPQPPAPKDLPL